ncbi:MAG: hypothetical protein COA42_08215 [Alteromonadaceae bacterium]|nr:MAG: hypothetical protein COA42_08215 [Alteromonadaceae bacterium]
MGFATNTSHQTFDTDVKVETPESIDLHARAAGPVPRMLAYTIDALWRYLGLAIVLMLISFMGDAGIGLFLLISFLAEWFYPVLFEVFRDGQTPGKKCMDLTVVNDNLTPVTLGTSLTRNLLLAADFFPAFFVSGIICMTLTGRFQRLGDLAAGSLVVYKNTQERTLSLPECEAKPSPFPLDIEEQIAITEFTQRHQKLSAGRKQELADILQDCLPTKGEASVTFLHSIGIWLLGGQR